MRIGINCQVVGRVRSGVEYYVLSLVQHMLRIDHTNQYVLFARGDSGIRTCLPAGRNVVVHESRLAGAARAGRIAWEQLCLPSLARHYQLDVLHCPAYVAPLRPTVPTVLTVHDTFALDQPAWCKRLNVLYYRQMLERSIARADRIISVSGASAAAVRRRVPDAQHRTEVIYPGIDEIFGPVSDSRVLHRVRARYGLPQRYVLFVGNIEPRKNLPNLIEGWHRFRDRTSLTHSLVIVGGKSWRMGRTFHNLTAAARAGGVLFAGYADRADLPAIYSMADVFAFPSLDEGFGFPPLEAMACGTPVVASTRGALAETLDGAALPVEPTSPDAIAQGLSQVLQDKNLRDRLVEEGYRCARRFTWSAAASATLRAYQLAAGRMPEVPVCQAGHPR